jgi:hypothetical protein
MPTSTIPDPDEEDSPRSYCDCGGPLTSLARPVDVSELNDHGILQNAFCLPPIFGPLLFDNEQSDCRDHCANERSKISPHNPPLYKP